MKNTIYTTLSVLFACTILVSVFWGRIDVSLIVRPNPISIEKSVLSIRRSTATTGEHIPDRRPGCSPVGNIVFVKTHKTGSTTVRAILDRYGLANNLSFLQHKDNPGGHINKDLNVLPLGSFLPPLGVHNGDTKRYRGYNISNTHLLLSVPKLRKLMDGHPTFITILRHPVEQWLSAFQYFHVEQSVVNTTGRSPVEVFLDDPLRYAPRNVYMWNNQLHDLGLNRSLFLRWRYVAMKMRYFSRLFSLVLITEYFDESLILLRKLLCWTFDDIVYVKMREQPEPLEADAGVRQRILEWNKADAMLYNHFNETLWRKIRDYGPDFEGDLRHFRDLLEEKYDECVGTKIVVSVTGDHKNINYGLKKRTPYCAALLGGTHATDIAKRQNNPPAVAAQKQVASSSKVTASTTPTLEVTKSSVTKRVKRPCNNSQGSIVFVKTHKTGSTTLTSILNRFGFARNLSFLQMASSGAGHFNYKAPSLSRRQDFLPPIGVAKGDFPNYRGYNISAVHIRYARELMDALMSGSGTTYYVTILREPVSQFISAFRYFNVAGILLPAVNSSSADFEESVLKVLNLPQPSLMINPFVWNNQLFDLGMSKPAMSNAASVRNHIAKLEGEFDLVLITEHFDESLILLKKLLCWEFEDILYIRKRMRPSTPGEDTSLSTSTMDRIRTHNHADGILYDYFNATLWRRVADYGPAFQDDLRTFRNLLDKTLNNCVEGTVVSTVSRRQENIKHVLKNNTSALCKDIVDSSIDAIRRRQGG